MLPCGPALAPSVYDGLPGRGRLGLEGTNGTLQIDEVHLVVSEFELEGADDACLEVDDDEEELEDCEEFEADPFLLDLPLDGGVVTVATEAVPEGVHSGFEFEVEDVDRAFFEAEIEIEMDFAEPLVVTDGGTASVTVVLDPSFTRPDGSVWDLSAFDYTGDEDDIVEFEAEFEDGVTEIEIDDD